MLYFLNNPNFKSPAMIYQKNSNLIVVIHLVGQFKVQGFMALDCYKKLHKIANVKAQAISDPNSKSHINVQASLSPGLRMTSMLHDAIKSGCQLLRENFKTYFQDIIMP